MSDEVVDAPFGKFLVTRGELIGETTRAGTLWDGPGFLQVIAKEHGQLGERGSTILDVGANQGAFSIWLARQGAWRVLAVEPQPVVMQRLKANLDLNRELTAGVVMPLEIAAYDQKGFLYQDRPLDPGNWGGTSLVWAERGIPAMPLDTLAWLFGNKVSLIKIDAQGCDGRVLYGLAETLLKDHPVIIFEWEERLASYHRTTLTDVLAFLNGARYEVHEWPTHPNNYLALPKRKKEPR